MSSNQGAVPRKSDANAPLRKAAERTAPPSSTLDWPPLFTPPSRPNTTDTGTLPVGDAFASHADKRAKRGSEEAVSEKGKGRKPSNFENPVVTSGSESLCECLADETSRCSVKFILCRNEVARLNTEAEKRDESIAHIMGLLTSSADEFKAMIHHLQDSLAHEQEERRNLDIRLSGLDYRFTISEDNYRWLHPEARD